MFQKAVRTEAKYKLALTGISGSGKTKSALRFARGLSPEGKIAVLDTEANSSSLYSDEFDFDVSPVSPPYTIDKFINAIKFAENNGYDVLIIDSISHAWAGEGGILNQKEKLDASRPTSNGFANWAKLTPQQDKFMAAILFAKIHVIVTMRSKTSYVLTQNDKGKQEPRKMGLAPIQRDGVEYEFTTVFDLNTEHMAVASKDRTPFFNDPTEMFMITEHHGGLVRDWLAGATAPAFIPQQAMAPKPQVAPKNSTSAIQAPKEQAPKFTMTLGSHKGKPFAEVPAQQLSASLDWLNSLANMTPLQKNLAGELEEYLMSLPPTDFVSPVTELPTEEAKP